jgi:hypothetical protein
MLRVAVLVRIENSEGKSVQAPAFTLVVNAHGGLMEASLELSHTEKITLINPQSGSMVTCRVVRVEMTSESNYTIAFEFDQRNAQFWPITFPPQDWAVAEELDLRQYRIASSREPPVGDLDS